MRNPMNHSPEYRRRRFANWFPLGLTYATSDMGRYNPNVSSTTMMDQFSLSKADFGMIATAGFWTYALAVMFNGPLADRIGGKKAILIGAVGASVLNLVIGLLFLNGWQTKIIVGVLDRRRAPDDKAVARDAAPEGRSLARGKEHGAREGPLDAPTPHVPRPTSHVPAC